MLKAYKYLKRIHDKLLYDLLKEDVYTNSGKECYSIMIDKYVASNKAFYNCFKILKL